jgi:hypothetical protein
MQSSHFGLDHLDQLLLQEEWGRLPHAELPRAERTDAKRRSGGGDDGCAACPPELSPVYAVLPGLIRLITECTDRPVEKFRPTIKRLILEQLFMEVGGDSIVDAHQMMRVNLYVELTVRVLVRIRRRDRDTLGWSDAPVTPQMFG